MWFKKKIVTDFISGSGTTTGERTTSAMLASVHATYEVRIIPCLQACVSRVGGVLQRCTQECFHDAWESRQAYLGECEAGARSLSLVDDLTMKKGVGLPCAN